MKYNLMGIAYAVTDLRPEIVPLVGVVFLILAFVFLKLLTKNNEVNLK